MTTPPSGNTSPIGGPNNVSASSQPVNPTPVAPGSIPTSGFAATNFFANIDPLNPPPIRTFVYSPQVRVIISHGNVQYDVSDDVVRCQLVRPENSAASFSVTLANKGSRYTPLDRPRFTPMDRIVVYMKKTGWLQVFSGYLDTVPYRQLYPGTVNIAATCTIKRLMHSWWNPDLPDSASLYNQSIQMSVVGDTIDSGLGGLLQQLLHSVGGWGYESIHIQQFPLSFFQFLTAMLPAMNQTDLHNIEKLKQDILGDATLTGPGSFAGSSPNAGTPGPNIGLTGPVGGIAGAAGLPIKMLFYVGQIVAACDEKGLGPLPWDNNLSAGLEQAGETGVAAMDPPVRKAFQQVQQTNLDAQNANRDSDGAILGVMAAMVDSGNSVSIRNSYSPGVPGSENFPNDGPVFSGNSVGIFGQPSSPEWGSLDQRMNPKQAAGMFMAHLAVLNWRTMDPGAACQMAQRTADAKPYSAIFQIAKGLVQAYRASGGASLTGLLGGGGGTSMSTSGVAGLAGAPSSISNAVPSVGLSTPGPAAVGGLNPARANKPQPDSEGAINWARTALGRPYQQGGHGPLGYDCSGLVSAAFKSIGINVPAQTEQIRANVPTIPNNAVARGDLVEPESGHVVLYCGATIIEASGDGIPVHEVPSSTIGPPSNWAWVGRACMNGGQDPQASFNLPESMGPGQPPGAITQVSAASSGAGGVKGGDGVALNLFSFLFMGGYASETAGFFGGRKAFVDGQPLIQAVQAAASASLRCWSSGPDGSFMAWYPDYWGLDGKPAVLRLEDIELKDVNIQLSDDPLATHVYINGSFDPFGGVDEVFGWLQTAGVVTVEDPDMWLWKRLAQVSPIDDGVSDGQGLMRRYGIRPLKKTYAISGSRELEFLLACKTFMEQWSMRYQTDISMTFMPELFPGMRVELANHMLEVYVTSVTHVCDYEQGFHTQATIVSPSTPYAKALMETVTSATGPSEDSMKAFNENLNTPSGT